MPSLIKSGIVVSVLVLAGRLTGFGREWFIAFRAGASEVTDIAIVLLTFPDLIVNILLGGGLTATLVPRFKMLTPGEGAALLLSATRQIGCAFALLALLSAIFAQPTMHVLAPGLDNAAHDSFVWQFRFVTIALPVTAISGVVVALLNSRELFAVGAAGTLLFNLSVIVCLVVMPSSKTVAAIAAGIVIGASLRLITQAVALKPIWTCPANRKSPIDRSLLLRFLGSFSFLTVLAALPALARAFSSLEDAGSLSLFNYAHKLIELPMGVVVGSVVIVLLPRLAENYIKVGAVSEHIHLIAGLRFTLLFSLIVAVPSVFFVDALVRTAFSNTDLQPEQLSILANLVSIGFITLPFQALLSVYGSAFAALGFTRSLVHTAFVMLVSVGMLTSGLQHRLGLNGVMFSYGIAYFLGAGLLTLSAARRFGWKTIVAVLRDARATILLPVLVGLITAYLGSTLTFNVRMRLTCAGLTALIMLSLVIVCDSTLRTACCGRLKKVVS